MSPSRPATLLRVQSTINGFAATGGAETAAVGVGVSIGLTDGVVAADGEGAGSEEALALVGPTDLAGPGPEAAGLDPGVVQAARTDVAIATTRSRPTACCFTSSLAV